MLKEGEVTCNNVLEDVTEENSTVVFRSVYAYNNEGVSHYGDNFISAFR